MYILNRRGKRDETALQTLFSFFTHSPIWPEICHVILFFRKLKVNTQPSTA